MEQKFTTHKCSFNFFYKVNTTNKVIPAQF